MIDFCTLLIEDFTLLGTLMNRLYQKLQARELWDLFCCVETKLVPLLAFMECQKVQIDTDKLLMFSEVLKVMLFEIYLIELYTPSNIKAIKMVFICRN